MARIDNLTNFLEDVAVAIKAKREFSQEDKILAAEFDTEIMKIQTGTGTEDADAVPSDLLYPKTAYVNGTKISGVIMPTYSSEGNPILSDTTITSDITMSRQITDINIESDIFISYNSNTLYLYKIINNKVDTENVVTYTNAELNITSPVSFGRAKLAPRANGDGTINLVIVTGQNDASGKPIYIYLFKVNIDTLEVTYCTVNSNSIYIGNQYHHITTTTKTLDVAFSSDTEFLVGTVFSSDAGSWGTATGYFRYAHMRIVDTDSLMAIKTGTNTTGAAGFTQGWDGTYPKFYMFYQDDYFQIYEEKNYRVTNRDGVNTFTYWSMFLNKNDYTFFYKTTTESTRNIYVKCKDYIIGNGQIFNIDDVNKQIGTTDYAPKYASYVGVMGNSVLNIYNGTCSIYAIRNNNATLSNSFPSTYGQYDSDGSTFVTQYNKDITLLTIEKLIIGLQRFGISYINTNDADAKREDILMNKTAYMRNALYKGTMPNNGELNYEVSTSEQTIPAGYTSGGTIAASPLTDSEYNECLEVTQEILGQNVSL